MVCNLFPNNILVNKTLITLKRTDQVVINLSRQEDLKSKTGATITKFSRNGRTRIVERLVAQILLQKMGLILLLTETKYKITR